MIHNSIIPTQTKGKLLTEQQKPAGTSEINTRIDTLNEQINKLKKETQAFIEKRDKLNEEFRKLRQDTQELKPERDSLNEKVQTFKMLRDETRSKTHNHRRHKG